MRIERIGDAVLYLGDCLKILPTLDKVDAVVTSPPYNLGNAKKGNFYGGKGKGETISYLSYSDDLDDDVYIKWQHSLFYLWIKLIGDDGVIAYNHKPNIINGEYQDKRKLIPFPIRQEIVWDRCCMVNFSGGFFAPQSERIFLVAGKDWKPNRESVGWGDIWRVAPEMNTPHPAPFPTALANKIINGCTKQNNTILDPFMGSGTTGVACVNLGRKFIGIEIEEKYFDISCERIAAAYAQGRLFA